MFVATTSLGAAHQTLGCSGLSIEDDAQLEVFCGRRQRGLQVGQLLAPRTHVVFEVNFHLVCGACSFATLFGFVSLVGNVAFDANQFSGVAHVFCKIKKKRNYVSSSSDERVEMSSV